MNKPSTASRRSRAPRIRIRCIVEIRGSRQSFLGEVRDLSVDGICFSSPIRMAPGERAGCSLCLLGGIDAVLPFEVRWSIPGAQTRSLIGGEFVHAPESRKAMEKLLWQIDSGAVTGAVRPEEQKS